MLAPRLAMPSAWRTCSQGSLGGTNTGASKAGSVVVDADEARGCFMVGLALILICVADNAKNDPL